MSETTHFRWRSEGLKLQLAAAPPPILTLIILHFGADNSFWLMLSLRLVLLIILFHLELLICIALVINAGGYFS